MKYELSVYELSTFLQKLEKEYKLDLLIKQTLSGGWMTIMGEAKVDMVAVQGGGCHGKDINILEIRLISDNNSGSLVKLTGAKGKKFSVDISSGRYRELSSSTLTLNKIKVNNDECKIRVGEDMIFTIKSSAEEVMKFIG